MGVAGHGVPVGSGIKLGKTHGKLAGLKNCGVDVLVDNSLVAILNASERTLCCLSDVDLYDRVGGVSGAGAYVELSGLVLVAALDRKSVV